jgi:anti-sigma B factor antagonist
MPCRAAHPPARGGVVSLSFETRRVGEIVVLKGTGRIAEGSEAGVLQQVVSELLPDNPYIVLDLADVTFIDSGGLGLLVRILSRARRASGDLKLAAVPRRISEVLRITHLDTTFESYPTDADAIVTFFTGATATAAPERFAADILCVDDGEDSLAYVCEVLRQAGYGVLPSGNLPDALVLLRASRPKLMVIGAELRAERGTWTAEAFSKFAEGLPVVELPADFTRTDPGDTGRKLLEEVRAAIGDRGSNVAAR